MFITQLSNLRNGVHNTLVYRRMVLQQNLTSVLCRACGANPETVSHILSACPSHGVFNYILRHNAALRVLYLHFRLWYGIDRPGLPYWLPETKAVVENERCAMYWNFSFSTTRPLQATKSDVVLIDRENNSLYVVELSWPAEKDIDGKEQEKRDKYRDLLVDLGQQYPKHRIHMVVLNIGCTGGIKLGNFIRECSDHPGRPARCRKQSSSGVCGPCVPTFLR